MSEGNDSMDAGRSHRGETTGDARVDAAVERLDDLDGRPTPEHADVYDDVHRRLHEVLTDLDGG